MKKENKICCILYAISTICFLISGLFELSSDNKLSIPDFSLALVFMSLSIVYYKKYKKEK